MSTGFVNKYAAQKARRKQHSNVFMTKSHKCSFSFLLCGFGLPIAGKIVLVHRAFDDYSAFVAIRKLKCRVI